MAALHAGAPDIVLTEVVMPDKCGIELIREIKRAKHGYQDYRDLGGWCAGPGLYSGNGAQARRRPGAAQALRD